jgi:hypothetical protein
VIYPILALAGLALTMAVPARAAESIEAPKSAEGAARGVGQAGVGRSPALARVADWVVASGDNGALPFIIVDKNAAALFLFDREGKPLGETPILTGIAAGDDATPGVGGKSLSELGPAEKTTPAGRFIAKYGHAAGRQRVLWVDYATSVAIHPLPNGNKKERRRARLLSPATDDNRITFGCINVPLAFYGKLVRPLFGKKGGVVYVLPDTKRLEDVFPRLRAAPMLAAKPGSALAQ